MTQGDWIFFPEDVDQSSSISRFELLIAPGAPCKTEAAIFLCLVFQLARRDDAIDQPNFTGAFGLDEFGSQEQFAKIAFAELTTQKSHDDSGDKAAPHFGIADFGLLGGDDKIAG